MRDILPNEAYLRDAVVNKILDVYRKYNFEHIETPALENIDNLRRQDGGENLSLIFEVLKRGDKLDQELQSDKINRDNIIDYGLRFDLTVPLVRYYVNNQASLANPFKAIQIGSVWRAERPQKGRFRQFTQCDIDIIGIKEESAEIELIDATANALLAVGFNDFEVIVNDRRLLAFIVTALGFTSEELAKAYILIDKIDKVGIEGIKNEAISIFQLEKANALMEMLAKLGQFVQANHSDLVNNFAQLGLNNLNLVELQKITQPLENVLRICRSLSQGKYSLKFEPMLARGMGYYTGMIFEIKAKSLAYSLAGGGRYDNMIGKIANRNVPACGFSIGFERVIGLLLENLTAVKTDLNKLALIYNPETDKLDLVMKELSDLQNMNYNVSVIPRKKDISKQLNQLIQHGFTKYCIFKQGEQTQLIKEFNL